MYNRIFRDTWQTKNNQMNVFVFIKYKKTGKIGRYTKTPICYSENKTATKSLL